MEIFILISTLHWLVTNLQTVVTVALAIVGAFSVLARYTKWEGDDKAAAWLYKIIHILAQNGPLLKQLDESKSATEAANAVVEKLEKEK